MPDPSAIAEYDQRLAITRDLLTHYVNTYRYNRAIDASRGWPEPVSVVGMSIFFAEMADQEDVASCLAVAVLEIARALEAQK